MRRLLALALSALLGLVAWPLSANAALSVVSLGSHHVTASTTNGLVTTTNDCPVGSLVVLFAGYTTITDTLSSVGDTAGNTWQTPFDNLTATGIGLGWAYAVNTTVDLPIGSTITATFSGATVSSVAAVCIGGAATSSPLDVSNKSASGVTSTSASPVSSGTLTQASEILLGGLATPAASGTVTCNGSYSKTVTQTGSLPDVTICTQIVASTASVSFAPSWANSITYITDLTSYKGVVSANTTHNLTTLGVGQ